MHLELEMLMITFEEYIYIYNVALYIALLHVYNDYALPYSTP